MRNQTFQMETGTSFVTQKNAGNIRTLLVALLAISFAINQSFATSPESEKGAALLLKQAAPVSQLERLPSEQQIPDLKALVLANASLPESVRFAETLREDGHTVRLAVHQRGSGTHQQTLVMIHGVLADHDAWRYLTGDLGD